MLVLLRIYLSYTILYISAHLHFLSHAVMSQPAVKYMFNVCFIVTVFFFFMTDFFETYVAVSQAILFSSWLCVNCLISLENV